MHFDCSGPGMGLKCVMNICASNFLADLHRMAFQICKTYNNSYPHPYSARTCRLRSSIVISFCSAFSLIESYACICSLGWPHHPFRTLSLRRITHCGISVTSRITTLCNSDQSPFPPHKLQQSATGCALELLGALYHFVKGPRVRWPIKLCTKSGIGSSCAACIPSYHLHFQSDTRIGTKLCNSEVLYYLPSRIANHHLSPTTAIVTF